MRTVSQYMQVSTIDAGNGIINVVTQGGTPLVDASAHLLSFTPAGSMLPTSYYPGGGLNGVLVDGTTDISAGSAGLGGEIGALLTLRDKTLPTYGAQIDELAQKMAVRFDQEGLKLFTDQAGNIPQPSRARGSWVT